MPDRPPSDFADESEWMGYCVPFMQRPSGDDMENDQAVAACMQMWSDKAAAADVTRAYSVLTIKSVDTEQRTIEGVASTPEVDRAGDIVEPLGAKFTLPMPLLWQHNSREPAVGHVTAAKATKDGISIKAKLAKIDEPGELKNTVDKAWQALKAGLVRGLSIGFSPIEYAFRDGGDGDAGGLRYTSWNWLELSLVTIPANQSATISLIKSLDQADPAASGTGIDQQAQIPGVSGKPTSVTLNAEERSMAKNIAEQIAALEATRAAKSARMGEVMQKSIDEGRSSELDEQEEFDTLQDEVKALDSDLTRLRALETINKASAKVVEAKTVDDGAAARGGNGNAASHVRMNDLSKLEPGIEFARMAKCLAIAKGDAWGALNVAKSMYPDGARIQNILEIGGKTGEISSDMVQKAASGGMTSTNSSLSAGLVGDETKVFADFVEWLRPQTIIGRFGANGVPGLTRVPFRTPLITQTSGATGYWVGEGAGKPVTNFDATRTTMTPLKSAAIAVCTKELIRDSSPAADALIRGELGRAIRERVNTTFIDPAASWGRWNLAGVHHLSGRVPRPRAVPRRMTSGAIWHSCSTPSSSPTTRRRTRS